MEGMMHMSSTMKMDMDMDMPMSKTHMWMYFHTSLADKVLFKSWEITTVGEMILACAIFFSLGISLEVVKFIRYYFEQKHNFANVYRHNMSATPMSRTNLYKQKLLSSAHFIQTILFGLQLCISYILMLVFMTFSIWLGLAVCLGTATGYLLFGARDASLSPQSQLNPNAPSQDSTQH